MDRYLPHNLTRNCWPSFWSDHANLNSSNQRPGYTSPSWAVHVVNGWFRRMLIRCPWLERKNQIRATRLLKQYLNVHTLWFQICSSLVQTCYLEWGRANLTKVIPLFTIEDLVTSHYWSCSVISILTNQVVISIQLPLGFSRLHARGHADWCEVTRTRNNNITGNNALYFKHEIMMQKANAMFAWTWSVMESYHIF